jgi:hypothetical protein
MDGRENLQPARPKRSHSQLEFRPLERVVSAHFNRSILKNKWNLYLYNQSIIILAFGPIVMIGSNSRLVK